MNIVFYSSSSNNFSASDTKLTTYPRRSDCLDELAEEYPEYNFSVVTQLPASFICDLDFGKINPKSKKVFYHLVDSTSTQDFVNIVLSQKPDLVIAMTFWIAPFDWMGLKDSLIADELRKNGVDVMCHSGSAQLICFDKKNTADFLTQNNFSHPKSVYVHHEYFWAERGRKEIASNNYKDFILSKVAQMNFPVVIKDCVGLSSYGMEVAVSYAQAVHYLKNGRNVSDRIVEEYIDGFHFGCEIYGRKGKYKILLPLIFSLNRYGITSPKLSVKTGPVKSADFKINELENLLQNLALALDLDGLAQVDLIFSDGKWFVVEINPRLSGMTETYAASMGKSVFQLMTETALGRACDFPDLKNVCNFKLPLLCDKMLENLFLFPQIKYVHQHEYLAAKQEREKGYCEAVLVQDSQDSSLLESFEKLKKEFPNLFDDEASKNFDFSKILC